MDFHFDYLTRRTAVLGLKLWVLFCIGLGACIVLVIIIGYLWRSSKRKAVNRGTVFLHKDSLEVRIHRSRKQPIQPVSDGSSSSPMTEDKKIMEEEIYAMKNLVGNKLDDELLHVVDGAPIRAFNLDKADKEYKGKYYGKAKLAARGEEVRREIFNKKQIEKGEPISESPWALSPEDSAYSPPTVSVATIQGSSLGWGHSYSRNVLEVATSYFSDTNILGEGSHGIVYYGQLQNGTRIALKKLLNSREQAEKEFRVEVEAIGRVRHKNLVRLIGCCMEGLERILVYEYINNGNVEQWLHGPLGDLPALSWEIRMKIILGTARGLAYLHEGLEPKVVHRDVKSRNILLDSNWNPKVSDFGFAKLLENGNAHVTTMVIGTYGYVAPEYASTGMLTEKSDVFSYGVLIMELVTGRLPVDVSRRHAEVNLVDWLKKMVANRRADEVIDPKIQLKPSSRSLKRVILVALRCVDPDAQRRPKMSHVVHMLEAANENQVSSQV